MLNLISPWWLTGLLAVPLIWWIHRLKDSGSMKAVAAAFLWRDLPGFQSRGRKLATADRIWRPRALIAALIVLALAGPIWIREPARLPEVWFDDSLSMLTREASGRTRLQLAIKKLDALLAEEEIPGIRVHSLSRSGAPVELARGELDSLELWIDPAASTRNSMLHPPPLSKGEHWLVTDGAGDGLQHWLERGNVSRIVKVGQATENLALTRLALRRSLRQPDSLLALVTVSNRGMETAAGELEVFVNGKRLAAWTLNVGPGQSRDRMFRIPLEGLSEVSARLSAGAGGSDPLPEDNRLDLTLDGQTWRHRVAVDPACGAPLKDALQALPGIALVNGVGGAADISLICSSGLQGASGPKVRFHASGNVQPVLGAPHWLGQVGPLNQLTLPPHLLRVSSRSPVNRAQPLLIAGNQMLAAITGEPDVLLEVFLDMELPALVRHPLYPVLVAGLLETALGYRLSGEIQSLRRDPAESQIAAATLELNPGRAQAGEQRTAVDLVVWLIVAGAAFLLRDMLKGLRAGSKSAGADL